MASNDTFAKMEAAMKVIADQAGIVGLQVATGLSQEALELPFVVCSVSGGTEEVKDTGIYRVNATVSVVTPADGHDLASHRDKVATIFDAFMQDDIADRLSAAVDDFHCYQAGPESQEQTTEDRHLINQLTLDAAICGQSL